MGTCSQGAGKALTIDIPLICQREALGRQLRPQVGQTLPGAQPKLTVLKGNTIKALQGAQGIAGTPEGGKAMAGPHHPAHAGALGRCKPALHRRFRGQGC